VISGRTNRVIGTIRVGHGADGVAVNSVTDRIYVTNDYDGTVSVISGRTRRVVATVRVGVNPQDAAVNATAGAAYVTNFVNGTVSVIRGRRDRVTSTIGLGGGPDAIAVNPSTGLLYVADNSGNDDRVAVIDPRAGSVIASIPLPGEPGGIAVDRRTNRIYVTSRWHQPVGDQRAVRLGGRHRRRGSRTGRSRGDPEDRYRFRGQRGPGLRLRCPRHSVGGQRADQHRHQHHSGGPRPGQRRRELEDRPRLRGQQRLRHGPAIGHSLGPRPLPHLTARTGRTCPATYHRMPPTPVTLRCGPGDWPTPARSGR
jgi:YVTN family beta-propeller protein